MKSVDRRKERSIFPVKWALRKKIREIIAFNRRKTILREIKTLLYLQCSTVWNPRPLIFLFTFLGLFHTL